VKESLKFMYMCGQADRVTKPQPRIKEDRKTYVGITILFVSFIILSGKPVTGRE
jgi:hypothetical protein